MLGKQPTKSADHDWEKLLDTSSASAQVPKSKKGATKDKFKVPSLFSQSSPKKPPVEPHSPRPQPPALDSLEKTDTGAGVDASPGASTPQSRKEEPAANAPASMSAPPILRKPAPGAAAKAKAPAAAASEDCCKPWPMSLFEACYSICNRAEPLVFKLDKHADVVTRGKLKSGPAVLEWPAEYRGLGHQSRRTCSDEHSDTNEAGAPVQKCETIDSLASTVVSRSQDEVRAPDDHVGEASPTPSLHGEFEAMRKEIQDLHGRVKGLHEKKGELHHALILESRRGHNNPSAGRSSAGNPSVAARSRALPVDALSSVGSPSVAPPAAAGDTLASWRGPQENRRARELGLIAHAAPPEQEARRGALFPESQTHPEESKSGALSPESQRALEVGLIAHAAPPELPRSQVAHAAPPELLRSQVAHAAPPELPRSQGDARPLVGRSLDGVRVRTEGAQPRSMRDELLHATLSPGTTLSPGSGSAARPEGDGGIQRAAATAPATLNTIGSGAAPGFVPFPHMAVVPKEADGHLPFPHLASPHFPHAGSPHART